ncbi:aldehyde dehydrogenase (NADP(+)) [Chromobacterium vaccinii]|uniref:Aldehyde dehydrogenase (NADP(+)) n=2 Tax=Chromobacterium vaccinii TaxID=1108595 RepID=A0A1D9LMF4_9NEIS|nr:aldehyde dehydrogenase (NADP(+)) [Chromobacterium vaccinii]AOZ52431.1 aldehyde dehydrogenase (NADP(+)) [Chromobacterium vaccinii]
MDIRGEMLIGGEPVYGREGELRARDPASGEALEPAFGCGGAVDAERACLLAGRAAAPFAAADGETRARLLEAIAAGLLALGGRLLERAARETGLPQARLIVERGRAVAQLRQFARAARQGLDAGAVLELGQPDKLPPRPDLRVRRVPIGPVAVFGAGNFPLAFSVAGGDTASALAAGCPVVVKAHPAHPGVSELTGRVIRQAAADCGLPGGVFSLLIADGHALGRQLVEHPAIAAVAFTGSRRGGEALMRAAALRPRPIPVYAEMGSLNPVLALPHALAARAETMAAAWVDALTLNAGQFCTCPSLLLAVEGEDLDRFRRAAANAAAAKPADTMLTPVIHDAYQSALHRLRRTPGVAELASGQAGGGPYAAQAALFEIDAAGFAARPELAEEVFGPCALIVACRDQDELLSAMAGLDGQLAATLQMDDADLPLARRLLPLLEARAGRVLANAFPNWVETSPAMVHGGPFPAGSDSRATSVGLAAMDRFLRPVCYQNLPAALLPPQVADDNPLRLWRRVDGAWSQG